jgi:hypothetical protein
VAIVTLRSEGRGWTYISQRVPKVSPNGALTYYNRVLERTDSRTPSLATLLSHIEDPSNRGGEERFPEDSAIANALKLTALQDRDHQDQPLKRIIKEVEQAEDVQIPYTTGYKTLRDAEVVKRVPPRKIELDQAHRDARFHFAEWALGKLHVAIFIFSDKMSIKCNSHRRRGKVSQLIRSNPFDSSQPPANTFKSVMV